MDVGMLRMLRELNHVRLRASGSGLHSRGQRRQQRPQLPRLRFGEIRDRENVTSDDNNGPSSIEVPKACATSHPDVRRMESHSGAWPASRRSTSSQVRQAAIWSRSQPRRRAVDSRSAWRERLGPPDCVTDSGGGFR